MIRRFLSGLGFVTAHSIIGPALLLCLCYLVTGQFLLSVIAGAVGALSLLAFRKLCKPGPKDLD